MLIGLLVIIVLGATLGGFAITKADEQKTTVTSNTTMEDRLNTLLEKVATIYEQNTGVNLSATELEKAYAQAEKSIQSAAQDEFLKKLVEEGKITQDQADKYKTWLDSKPDVPDILNGAGPGGNFSGKGMMGNRMSRPDNSGSNNSGTTN
jgi:hypothetical protein